MWAFGLAFAAFVGGFLILSLAAFPPTVSIPLGLVLGAVILVVGLARKRQEQMAPGRGQEIEFTERDEQTLTTE
jgi:hypothetical protein